MNSGDLTLLLDRLLAQAGEHEWLEFKHNDDPHTMGEYVSALANAAALDGEPFGYMVWGIENDTRRVVGSPAHLEQGAGFSLLPGAGVAALAQLYGVQTGGAGSGDAGQIARRIERCTKAQPGQKPAG